MFKKESPAKHLKFRKWKILRRFFLSCLAGPFYIWHVLVEMFFYIANWNLRFESIESSWLVNGAFYDFENRLTISFRFGMIIADFNMNYGFENWKFVVLTGVDWGKILSIRKWWKQMKKRVKNNFELSHSFSNFLKQMIHMIILSSASHILQIRISYFYYFPFIQMNRFKAPLSNQKL